MFNNEPHQNLQQMSISIYFLGPKSVTLKLK